MFRKGVVFLGLLSVLLGAHAFGAATIVIQNADPAASPTPPVQAAPRVVEPEFPLKPVDADPPIPLPGL